MEFATSIFLLAWVTGLFAAAATIALLWLVVGRFLRSRLMYSLENAGDMVAEKVRRAVLEAADEALPKVKEGVAQGVGTAAEGILPTLRQEVQGGVEDAIETSWPRVREQLRSGVTEGIASAVTGGSVSRAGEEILRKSGSVIDAGLDLLLGSKKRGENDI